MAQSGNGIDIGTVYNLLLQMSVRLDSMERRLDTMERRLDSNDRKLDQLLDVVNEHSRILGGHTRRLDDLEAGITGLRGEVSDYHRTVAGHGIHYAELAERVDRVEQHLKLGSSGE